MRNACWTLGQGRRFLCPLCAVGDLLTCGQGSARCASLLTFLSGTGKLGPARVGAAAVWEERR
jgi:hypothetical protein